MSDQLFRIVLLLTAAAMILTACAAPTPAATQVSPATQVTEPTQASTATPIPTLTPTTVMPTAAPSPQATAVPATPTSVPTMAIDPNRPNDLTEARLRVSQCVRDPKIDGLATDVYINGKVPVTAGVPLTNLPPGSVSRYEYLAPGTVNVEIVPSDMGTDTLFIAPLDLTLEAGHRYTVVVLGDMIDPSHKTLVIDETEAYKKAGASPNSSGHITVNNVKGATTISFLFDGVGEKDVPYGEFGASAQPAGKFTSFNVSVGEHVDKNGAGFNWPGLDWLDCFYGWYKGPTSTYTNGWSSESTSDLNAIDFLQGVSDQHLKNGGEVFGNSPSFDTFLTAVKNAGLTDLLTSGGPHLVFAPTDKAFASLPKDQLDALMADPKALGDFVRAYIVEGYYPRGTLGEDLDNVFDRTVTNLLGKELMLSGEEGNLKINGGSMGYVDSAMVANGTRVFWVAKLMKPASK